MLRRPPKRSGCTTVFSLIKDWLFGYRVKPDALAKMSLDPQRRDEFLFKLAENGVIILGQPEQPSEVRHSLESSDTLAYDEIQTYSKDGKTILPVFTSEGMAVAFAFQGIKEITLCAYYIVVVDVILDEFFSCCEIMLNPETPYARPLSSEDIQALRKLRPNREMAFTSDK